MKNRFKFPEPRDPQHYAPWESETAWIMPFDPPPVVECVWCGVKVSGEAWEAHQIAEHYYECVLSWVRGIGPLKRDGRWRSHAKRIKYIWNGQRQRA